MVYKKYIFIVITDNVKNMKIHMTITASIDSNIVFEELVKEETTVMNIAYMEN